MYHNTEEHKALLLSKEETLALLDMCLNSHLEMEAIHENALTKLSDMARCYIAEEMLEETMRVDETGSSLERIPLKPPVRMAFWTRSVVRASLRNALPVSQLESCR